MAAARRDSWEPVESTSVDHRSTHRGSSPFYLYERQRAYVNENANGAGDGSVTGFEKRKTSAAYALAAASFPLVRVDDGPS